MWNRIVQYPARLQAVIVSLTVLLTVFGVPWSELQLAAISTFTATVIALFLEGVPGRSTDV